MKFVFDFLEEFDRVVGEIACCEDDRPIPFNGLKLQVFGHQNYCPTKNPGINSDFESLRMHLNLKYLHIDTVQGSRVCPIHDPLAALLRHSCSQLKVLKPTIGLYFLIQLCKKGLNVSQLFPALQVLNMSDLRMDDWYNREEEKESLKELLVACPKLKQLIATDVCELKLFPKQKLKSGLELQDNLNFRMARHEDLDFLKITSAADSSNIKTLFIYIPPFEGQTQSNYSPEDKTVD